MHEFTTLNFWIQQLSAVFRGIFAEDKKGYSEARERLVFKALVARKRATDNAESVYYQKLFSILEESKGFKIGHKTYENVDLIEELARPVDWLPGLETASLRRHQSLKSCRFNDSSLNLATRYASFPQRFTELKSFQKPKMYALGADLACIVQADDTLRCAEQTLHMIGGAEIKRMRKGVMIINTGRGALVETKALIAGLKTDHIGSAGLDVYEEEEGVFFQDLSGHVLQDDTLARLLTFPNVLITSHQAFLTTEALYNIAETTLKNISDFAMGRKLINEVS